MDFDKFFYTTADNFSMCGYGCIFSTEYVNDIHGQHQALMVQRNTEKSLQYAFNGIGNLCTTTEFGSPIEENLLAKFISLPNEKVRPLLQFWQEHGFFFPLSNESIEVDWYVITEIVNRLKATTQLMTMLSTNTYEVHHLLLLTIYLLLGDKVTLTYGVRNAHTTYRHPVITHIESSAIEVNNENIIECEDGDFYSIRDVIFSPSYLFPVDEYNDIASNETFMYNYPGIGDSFYRHLVKAYKANNATSKQHHFLIDFLFHFMHEVGVIKSVSFSGIEFYGKPNYSAFTGQLEKALPLVARIILAGEINYNVSRMRPQYSSKDLAPTWKAPNLLTALYFSAFYMKPHSEIYRKCANPSCTNYFQVKTTNGRKIYCCKKCRDAANQRAHRSRLLK